MTKKLCRAGVVAALYVVLTFVFSPIAFGKLQFRPAEALCLLPLLFPETTVGLFVGCLIANLSSPYLFFDLVFGSSITLVAANCTMLVGKKIKKTSWKILLGGLFPVLFNALFLPIGWVFLMNGAPSVALYLTYAASLLFTQSACVFLLGSPVYLALEKMTKNTG